MTALLNDPQWQSFLAAIRANLADDTVRLVAADWLDENAGLATCGECEGRGRSDKFMRATDWFRGKTGTSTITTDCPKCSGSGRVSNGFAEYAELIRIQCEIAKQPLAMRCPECDEVECHMEGTRHFPLSYECPNGHKWDADRVDDLRKRAEELWIPPTSRSVSTSAHTVGLATVILDGQPQPGSVYRSWGIARRGFIEEILCPMSTWLEHGPKIVRLPTAAVRKVAVTDRESDRVPDPLPFTFWRNVGAENRGAWIPEEIFDLMSGKADEHMTPFGWLSDLHKHYGTADLANAALSDACLAWAWASEPAVNV